MIKMIIIHLYNNLKLVGQVKLNEEGDYPVTLYTIDTTRQQIRKIKI